MFNQSKESTKMFNVVQAYFFSRNNYNVCDIRFVVKALNTTPLFQITDREAEAVVLELCKAYSIFYEFIEQG
jgi:hypothetical protein